MGRLHSPRSYQIRLYKADGTTSLVYDFLGKDDKAARDYLARIECEQFDRFEIWCGMVLIEDGLCNPPH